MHQLQKDRMKPAGKNRQRSGFFPPEGPQEPVFTQKLVQAHITGGDDMSIVVFPAVSHA